MDYGRAIIITRIIYKWPHLNDCHNAHDALARLYILLQNNIFIDVIFIGLGQSEE